MSKNPDAILQLPPGYLNEFDLDDVDQESIDFQSESWEAILARMRDKVYTPNKFKTYNTLVGIMLRADKRSNRSQECTPFDFARSAVTPSKKKYDLYNYRIRVPELHFMLDVPSSLSNPSKMDKLIIDSYPLVQAEHTGVQRYPVKPGDLVLVRVQNQGAVAKIQYAGPLDAKHQGRQRKGDTKKDCSHCYKKYGQRGSKGDCLGNDQNLNKFNNGVPPVVTKPGATPTDDIKTKNHAKWLHDLLKPLKKDYFPGPTFIGTLGGNGENDRWHMLQKAGRQTFIYIPPGCKTDSEIELLYYFHDNLGFPNDPQWWKRIGNSIKNASKANSDLGANGARRNFVVVIPELPWSKQATKNADTNPRSPRVDNHSHYNTMNGQTAFRYTGRHWKAFSSNDSVSLGPKFYSKKPLGAQVQGGFPNADETTKSSFGDPNKFFDNVKKTLKKQFNLDSNYITFTTLACDRYGTAIVSNLARENKLIDIFGDSLKKIQLFHGDYSGTKKNAFHDNDLKDIIVSIDNSTQLEIHISHAKTQDLGAFPNGNSLPTFAASSFVGALSHISKKNIANDNFNYNEAVQKLADFYNTNLLFGESAPNSAGTGAKYNTLFELLQTGAQFTGATGTMPKTFNDNKGSLRMLAPWGNVLLKVRPGSPAFSWIEWLPSPTAGTDGAPSTLAVENIKLSEHEVHDATDGKSMGTFKNLFKSWKGKVILFKSDHLGKKKNAAIIRPAGSDPTQEYEMIFFFHDTNAGFLSTKQGWRKEIQVFLQDAMTNAGGRNIVYVTMDLVNATSENPSDSSFGASNTGNFSEFLVEVLDNMKHWPGSAHPKFINFKAFGKGSYPLFNIVNKMSGQEIKSLPLRRIDLLDASYAGVFDQIVSKTSKWNPGDKFELQVFSTVLAQTWEPSALKYLTTANSSGFNGHKTVNNITHEGMFLEMKNGSHSSALTKNFFLSPTLLEAPGYSWNPAAAPSPLQNLDINTVPIAFDDKGKAYGPQNNELPAYNLSSKTMKMLKKCAKGNIKRQVAAASSPVSAFQDCLKKCLGETKITGKKPPKIPKGNTDCKKNPLGLYDLQEKFKNDPAFAADKVSKSRNSHWGNFHLIKFIRNGMALPMFAPPAGSQATFRLRDASPEWSNGVDRIGFSDKRSGHSAHRDGYDMDVDFVTDFGVQRANWKWHVSKEWLKKGNNLKPANKGKDPWLKSTSPSQPTLDIDVTICMGFRGFFSVGRRNPNKLVRDRGMVLLGDKKNGGKYDYLQDIKVRIGQIYSTEFKKNVKDGKWRKPTEDQLQVYELMKKHWPDKNTAISKLTETGKGVFRYSPGHRNHYHIRAGTYGNAGRNTKRAIQTLQTKFGCKYEGPHEKSNIFWRQAYKESTKSGPEGVGNINKVFEDIVKKAGAS